MKEIRIALLKAALKTEADGRTGIESMFDSMRVKYSPEMQNLDPRYDETIDEEKMRVMLYLGDD